MAEESNRQKWIRGKSVLELGCGLGLLGIVAAKCGARTVVLTDLPHCLPPVMHNLQINGFADPNMETKFDPETNIHVRKLYWGDPLDTAAVQKLEKTFDLVILSEVFHWPGLDILEDDTRIPLLYTLLTMTHPGSIVLLAYKFRVHLSLSVVFSSNIMLGSWQRSGNAGYVAASLLHFATLSAQHAVRCT